MGATLEAMTQALHMHSQHLKKAVIHRLELEGEVFKAGDRYFHTDAFLNATPAVAKKAEEISICPKSLAFFERLEQAAAGIHLGMTPDEAWARAEKKVET